MRQVTPQEERMLLQALAARVEAKERALHNQLVKSGQGIAQLRGLIEQKKRQAEQLSHAAVSAWAGLFDGAANARPLIRKLRDTLNYAQSCFFFKQRMEKAVMRSCRGLSQAEVNHGVLLDGMQQQKKRSNSLEARLSRLKIRSLAERQAAEQVDIEEGIAHKRAKSGLA